ncbi:MAG: M64 family metallopeptidase, partial [Candidatus Roizmanbacteria bacterium]|nr:M64 family metallopeptidase [Candidatus Roizmanbacteria bacterium]
PADSVWKNTILSSSFYTFDSERYCMTEDHKSVRDLAANAPYDQIYILTNTTKYGGGGIFNFYSMSSSSNRFSAAIIVHEFGHSFAGLGDEYFDSSTSYNDFYNLTIEPWEPNLTSLVDFDSKWSHLLAEDTPVPTPSDTAFIGKTGVFEGAGYVAKGMYRPAFDCLMHTFRGNRFCKACEEAISKMVEFYAD